MRIAGLTKQNGMVVAGKIVLFIMIACLPMLTFYDVLDGTQIKTRKQVAGTTDIAMTYNNLANSYLFKLDLESLKSNASQLDTAIFYYRKAMMLDSMDGGIKLNLGIAYLINGDTTAADSLFTLGIAQCDSNLSTALYLLGMDISPEEKSKGVAVNVTEEKLKSRLSNAKQNLDSKKKAKSGKKPSGKTRPAGPKSLDPQQVKKYLYWKQ